MQNVTIRPISNGTVPFSVLDAGVPEINLGTQNCPNILNPRIFFIVARHVPTDIKWNGVQEFEQKMVITGITSITPYAGFEKNIYVLLRLASSKLSFLYKTAINDVN